MNRHTRRALEQRSDRALARARGSVVAVDSESIVFVREDGDVRSVAGVLVAHALGALGLAGLHAEIVKERARRSHAWIPVVIIIDGQATWAWTEAHHLSRGGVA